MAGPVIKHTDLFPFDEYKKNIQEVSDLTVQFGNTFAVLIKELSSRYEKLSTELSGIKNNIKSISDAKGLSELSKQADGLSESIIGVKDGMNNAKKAVTETEGSLASLKTRANELKKEYENLSDSQLKNKTVVQPILKEYGEINQTLTQHKKVLTEATKSVKVVSGSYTELSKQLTDMKNELKNMPDAFDPITGAINRNNKAAVELSKKITVTDTSLKKMDAGMGVYTRNVGNYASAFESLPGPLGNAASGVNNFGKSLLKLLANPIVLIISAIVAAFYALYKAFSSTDSGSTELAARFEQLKAIIDVIRVRVVGLISALISFVKGNWSEAAAKFKEAVTGVGSQLREATRAAYAYAKAVDALEDSENNYISRASEIRNKIAKLEYNSADRRKSVAERRAALQEAMKLSEEEVLQQKKFAEQKLMNEVNYLAGKNKVRAQDILAFIQMTDEEQANASSALQKLRDNYEGKFKEIEELYAKAIDADTKFFEENKRNLSKLSGFDEDIRKEIEDRIKKQNELKLQLEEENAKNIEKVLENQQKQIEKDIEDFIKIEDQNREDSLKKEEDYNEKRIKQAFEAGKKIVDDEEKNQQKKKEAVREWFNYASQAITTFTDAFSVGVERRISLLESEKEMAIAAAGDNANAKARIEDEYNKKIAKEKRKIAIADKIGAIFQVGISTAVGIMEVLKKFPLPLGLPFVIATAALGAVQAATIAAKPIPKYKSGIDYVPTNQLAEINDQPGPTYKEMVIRDKKAFMAQGRNQRVWLKRGDKVIKASRVSELLAQMEMERLNSDSVLHENLNANLINGKRKEAEIIMSNALMNSKISEKAIGDEIGKHLQEIPVQNHIYDERGYRRSIRKGNTEVTELNQRNSL